MKKSIISAIKEAVKHLHAVLTAPTSNHCRKPWFIMTSLTSRDSMLLMECKLHYVPMVYRGAFQ